MFDKVAEETASLIGDYQNDWGINITTKDVISWVNQFDQKERLFILEEMNNIFQKTYISKTQCIELLKKYLPYLASHYKYKDVNSFLKETKFLSLQKPEKSQSELLVLVDSFLMTDYNVNLLHCGKTKIKQYIYLDDILATGNKAFYDLTGWLNEKSQIKTSETNLEYIVNNKIPISCCFLCIHDWGHSNLQFRLEKECGLALKKLLSWFYYYKINNNIMGHNPSLNLIYPCEDLADAQVKKYLDSLSAEANQNRAFRKRNVPKNEEFFTSPANRVNLERIFLKKGIEILNSVANLQVQNIRPLGYTVKSHKTLGLGTLFFTWRNIPNNCPIVFWWNNNGWKPLFNLRGRG